MSFDGEWQYKYMLLRQFFVSMKVLHGHPRCLEHDLGSDRKALTRRQPQQREQQQQHGGRIFVRIDLLPTGSTSHRPLCLFLGLLLVFLPLSFHMCSCLESQGKIVVLVFGLEQRSQTRGPHVARLMWLCGPRHLKNYKIWLKLQF